MYYQKLENINKKRNETDIPDEIYNNSLKKLDMWLFSLDRESRNRINPYHFVRYAQLRIEFAEQLFTVIKNSGLVREIFEVRNQSGNETLARAETDEGKKKLIQEIEKSGVLYSEEIDGDENVSILDIQVWYRLMDNAQVDVSNVASKLKFDTLKNEITSIGSGNEEVRSLASRLIGRYK